MIRTFLLLLILILAKNIVAHLSTMLIVFSHMKPQTANLLHAFLKT